MIARLVQVCGVIDDIQDRSMFFVIRYVMPDGELSIHHVEVMGWFKSIKALPDGEVRRIDPRGRTKVQLTFKITEKVA